jgi:hypothetical protein
VPLQEYFRHAPQLLTNAANQRLVAPYNPRLHWGRAHVTKPEARLSAMISIADHTRAEELYKAVVGYTQTLVSFWQGVQTRHRAGMHDPARPRQRHVAETQE